MSRNDTIILTLEMFDDRPFSIPAHTIDLFASNMVRFIDAAGRVMEFPALIELPIVNVRRGSIEFHFGPHFHFHPPEGGAKPSVDKMKYAADFLSIVASAATVLALGADAKGKPTPAPVQLVVASNETQIAFSGIRVALSGMRIDCATLRFPGEEPIKFSFKAGPGSPMIADTPRTELPWKAGRPLGSIDVLVQDNGPVVQTSASSPDYNTYLCRIDVAGVIYHVLAIWTSDVVPKLGDTYHVTGAARKTPIVAEGSFAELRTLDGIIEVTAVNVWR